MITPAMVVIAAIWAEPLIPLDKGTEIWFLAD
jgi:hypothetical protein